MRIQKLQKKNTHTPRGKEMNKNEINFYSGCDSVYGMVYCKRQISIKFSVKEAKHHHNKTKSLLDVNIHKLEYFQFA